MNMSFKEKSIWISLIATIIIFGFYFSKTFPLFRNFDDNNTEMVMLFIGVVILMIIVQIISHIVLAVFNRKDAEAGEDERDKLVELKATRIAHFVLITGVWLTASCLLITKSPLMLVNIMIFFFILSEVLGFIAQLFYYRKGI